MFKAALTREFLLSLFKSSQILEISNTKFIRGRDHSVVKIKDICIDIISLESLSGHTDHFPVMYIF